MTLAVLRECGSSGYQITLGHPQFAGRADPNTTTEYLGETKIRTGPDLRTGLNSLKSRGPPTRMPKTRSRGHLLLTIAHAVS